MAADRTASAGKARDPGRTGSDTPNLDWPHVQPHEGPLPKQGGRGILKPCLPLADGPDGGNDRHEGALPLKVVASGRTRTSAPGRSRRSPAKSLHPVVAGLAKCQNADDNAGKR